MHGTVLVDTVELTAICSLTAEPGGYLGQSHGVSSMDISELCRSIGM